MVEAQDDEITVDFDAQELLNQLPDAYRMVFNLYVLEGYSHQEISDTLQISLAVSKTQLFRAKEKLRVLYLQQQKTMRNEHAKG